MPSLIEDYVQSLLNAVADSPIVSASNIQLDKRTNRSGLIRGDLFFGDGSRYDDTPHHPETENFPHHKHIEQEGNIVASAPPTLVSVLDEIERIFPLNR